MGIRIWEGSRREIMWWLWGCGSGPAPCCRRTALSCMGRYAPLNRATVRHPASIYRRTLVVLVARSLTAVSIYRASSDTPIGVAPLAKGASSTPLVVLQPYSRPSRSSGTNHAPTGQLISNETTLQRVSLVQRTTKTNITSNGQLLQGSAKLQ
jgi:hypothetical protein